MVLWGVVGVRSLAGPTAGFTFVFLSLLVLSAAWEACGCIRRGDGGGEVPASAGTREGASLHHTHRTTPRRFTLTLALSPQGTFA